MAGLNWGESESSTKLLHTVQYYGLHTGLLQHACGGRLAGNEVGEGLTSLG